MTENPEEEYDEDIRVFFSNVAPVSEDVINPEALQKQAEAVLQMARARERAYTALVWLGDLQGGDLNKAARAFTRIIEALQPGLRNHMDRRLRLFFGAAAHCHAGRIEEAIQELWFTFWRERCDWPDGRKGINDLYELAWKKLQDRIRLGTVPRVMESSAMPPVALTPKRRVAKKLLTLIPNLQEEIPDLSSLDEELLRTYVAEGVTIEWCRQKHWSLRLAKERLVSLLLMVRRHLHFARMKQYEPGDVSPGVSPTLPAGGAIHESSFRP